MQPIPLFWNHSEQHSSKTVGTYIGQAKRFWNHSEQHSSKTWCRSIIQAYLFWNHSEQHSSKTRLLMHQHYHRILEPFRTTQL